MLEINQSDLKNQDKDTLISFVDKTKKTIPLLTDENLLENETKEKLNIITDKIFTLSENFSRSDYPNESAEEEEKRIQEANQEGTWSASSTSIENTIEIPSIPKTKRGLKFQAAAVELNLISDEFFELRNHNPQYRNAYGKLSKEIKDFRSNLNSSDEIVSSFAKDILKIARRIEYASIFLLMLSLICKLRSKSLMKFKIKRKI